MRVVPSIIQHLLRSRAERCPPKIQRGSGHPRRAGAPEGALDVDGTGAGYELYVRRAVWPRGMLYADEACIVSRSPQGFAKMMEVIVEVCRAFALTVKEGLYPRYDDRPHERECVWFMQGLLGRERKTH